MLPEDEEKTAFFTEYGLFCWKVMPFGLKNAGATYQRMHVQLRDSTGGISLEVLKDSTEDSGYLKFIISAAFDEECAHAFDKLKEYLGSPKLLSLPEPMEELQLYLAVSEGAISSMMVRETEGAQNPIYYVSHVLHGVEENYPTIDKFTFAVLISSRKLKIYFEAHQDDHRPTPKEDLGESSPLRVTHNTGN
ncbi:hypothetical protein LIER_17620 [Lithospermum erythrorhizon]|uniref:Reverse transcriptase/retrotransposon-derived protein RNase H-like domain-containing protein n=1 Tax=Lithospermum erythrorhizon TaxID=34254 RepID=A0AAV3QDJ4_LITER